MAGIDPMRLFAMWMFAHEEADEIMKASVARGEGISAEGMSGGADAFTDGFMAMVSEEKERLKADMLSGDPGSAPGPEAEAMQELRFEVAELRGRLDQMQTTLDVIASRVAVRS